MSEHTVRVGDVMWQDDIEATVEKNGLDVPLRGELIYCGRTADTIRARYREYSSDDGLVRRAMSLEVSYLFDGERTECAFLGFLFLVTAADNVSISFQVSA